MYKVYWTELHRVHSEEFEETQLTETLKFMENLRRERRNGIPYSFITMVSENPNSVGQAGVDVTGPGYKDEWDKKHRGAGPSV